MPVTQLQHFNVRCADVEASRHFYVTVLGLRQGPRPPFPSEGYWLYLNQDACVHLVQKKPGEAKPGPGTGALDHVAFESHDLEGMRQILKANGYSFREAIVPRDNVTQVFVADPDGVMLELNFAPEP